MDWCCVPRIQSYVSNKEAWCNGSFEAVVLNVACVVDCVVACIVTCVVVYDL